MSRPKDRFARPVLITGAPFSGITKVAGLFYKHGLWLGKSDEYWDISEPRFQYENPVLRSQVNQKILGLIDADPFRVDKIPELSGLPTTGSLKSAIKGMVRKQGYDGSHLWGFKDFRMSLLWPLWQKEFPDARWVIVKRPRSNTIRTCLNMQGTRKISLHEHYWYNWCEIYDERLQALRTAVSHSFEIDANALEYGEIEQIQGLMDLLGLDFDLKITKQHFKPGYRDDEDDDDKKFN